MAVASLLNATITTAVTGSLSGIAAAIEGTVSSVALQAVFTYGSGGTNATAYVQTSIDGGATWIDVACFQFTTSSAKSVGNLSATTAVTTLFAPTDGSLTANTTKDGVIGPQWRVKIYNYWHIRRWHDIAH